MLCVLLRDLRLRNIPLKYTTPSLSPWYMLLLKVYTLFITLVHDTCVIKFHGGANILLYEVHNRYSFKIVMVVFVILHQRLCFILDVNSSSSSSQTTMVIHFIYLKYSDFILLWYIIRHEVVIGIL